MKYGIGQPVPRTEDARFLTGRGRYVADIDLPGQAHGYVLRSPHAHARIVEIDTAAARALPGVLAVLTGADYAADGLGGIPCLGPPAGAVQPPSPALVTERVRWVGAPVAFVVAETAAQAAAAAEAIAVEFEALPAVADIAQALAPGAPAVWDEAPDNVCFAFERGDRAATEAAFAAARHVTRLTLRNNRLTAAALEPRGAIGAYDAAADRYLLHLSTQSPQRVRHVLARSVFRIPPERLRVIGPDVGGGFGMKGAVYPEDALVLWAARLLGRPVKWIAERSEDFLADTHGRDQLVEAELALDGEGRILALRADSRHNVGACPSVGGAVPARHNSALLSGVYAIPAIHVAVRGVFTNTVATGPYRGAGRPEAAYLVERLIDAAARETGVDPVTIRRRNFIAPDSMPHRTPLGTTYDSGSFEALMDAALARADWAGFAARKAASERRGRLRGRGLACYLESAGLLDEHAEIRIEADGGAVVTVGTFSHGQGHETAYAQMVAEWLGVPFAAIRLIQGDTDKVAGGRGTFASRSMTLGGGALRHAADGIIDKATRIAAHLLEVAEADIAFVDGSFAVAGTDRGVTLAEVARAAHAPGALPPGIETGLAAAGDYAAGPGNFPNGCQVAEVEIDPETGAVALVRLTVVDDVGRVINPLLLDGQVHGGIAQGIGQALSEEIRFEPDSAQLLTASFMDYGVPRADDLPAFAVATRNVPTPTNPLGVKGAGETGTVGAPPAAMLAVLDALAPFGIVHLDMPATPERIWRAMRAARTG